MSCDNLENTTDAGQATDAIIDALDNLPILARLEFVKNLICDKGGNKSNYPSDPVLITATGVLEGVIDILKKHPRAAKLSRAEP